MASFKQLTKGLRLSTSSHPPSNSSSSYQPPSLLHKEALSQSNSSQEQAYLRHKFKIMSNSQGSIPNLLTTFSSLDSRITSTLKSFSIQAPTPIQMQAIPALLQRRDLIACAPTGSGKTLAFVLPVLENTARNQKNLQGVIMAPTRELTIQLYKEFLLYNQGRQRDKRPRIRFLRNKVIPSDRAEFLKFQSENDVVVGYGQCQIGTPERVERMLKFAKTKDFKELKYLILDEADKLFEKNFIEQIDLIARKLLKEDTVTKAMFSATLQENLEQTMHSLMTNPLRVVVGKKNTAVQNVTQQLIYTGSQEGKLLALRNIFQSGFEAPVMIFVQSKRRVRELFNELQYDNVKTGCIHGGLSKHSRDQVVDSFRKGDIWVLICSDVMGRGVDFKGLNMVINFDFPQSGVDYIHRVGRTGRLGRAGRAVTFYTDKDVPMLRTISNAIKQSGGEVADWMLNLKRIRSKEKRKLAERPVSRKSISTSIGLNRSKRFEKEIEKREQKQRKAQKESEKEGGEEEWNYE